MDIKIGPSDGFYVDIQMPGGSRTVDGARTVSERTVRWEVPREIDPAQIQNAKVGLEQLAKVLHENPKDASELLKAVSSNDVNTAHEIARRIGTSGGAIIVDPIIVIVIVIIIIMGG